MKAAQTTQQGGVVWLRPSPIPTHADYIAGYEVGQRNAKRQPNDGGWEYKPSNVSAQWGLGHSQAIADFREQ